MNSIEQMKELDGKMWTIEKFLKEQANISKCDIKLATRFGNKSISLENLQVLYEQGYLQDSGEFWYYEDDDGVFDNRTIIRKILWFIVKEKK